MYCFRQIKVGIVVLQYLLLLLLLLMMMMLLQQICNCTRPLHQETCKPRTRCSRCPLLFQGESRRSNDFLPSQPRSHLPSQPFFSAASMTALLKCFRCSAAASRASVLLALAICVFIPLLLPSLSLVAASSGAEQLQVGPPLGRRFELKSERLF